MNIPQEAIEAAYNAFQHPNRMLLNTSDGNRKGRLEAALEAALPAIEKEIRAQVAAELRGELIKRLYESCGDRSWFVADSGVLDVEIEMDDDLNATSYNFTMEDFRGAIGLGSIAEHAARIAEGADNA